MKEVDAGSGILLLKVAKNSKRKAERRSVQGGNYRYGKRTRYRCIFTVYDGKESIPDKQPYIISIETDKDQYKAGESVISKLLDIKKGRALISIEKGNQVVEMVWHDLKKVKAFR